MCRSTFSLRFFVRPSFGPGDRRFDLKSMELEIPVWYYFFVNWGCSVATSTAPFVYKGPPDPFSTSVSPRLNGVLLPLKSHIQWRKYSGYPLLLSRATSLLAPPTPHSTDEFEKLLIWYFGCTTQRLTSHYIQLIQMLCADVSKNLDMDLYFA